MEEDTAGNLIKEPFLHPCPVKCGLTGGCEECNNNNMKDCKICNEDPTVCEERTCPCHNFGITKNNIIKEQLEKSREEFDDNWYLWSKHSDGSYTTCGEEVFNWHIQQQTALLEAIMKWAEEKEKEIPKDWQENYQDNYQDDEGYNQALEDLKKELTKSIKDN